MSDRPVWKFKTPIDLARWLLTNRVVKIRHNWKMTSNDTAEYWLELSSQAQSRNVPTDLFETSEFCVSPDYSGLIRPKFPFGIDMRAAIEEIDEWDKANEHDRKEYERLKKKFEG